MQESLRRLLAVLGGAMGLGVAALLVSTAMHATQWVWPDWLPYRLAGRGYEDDIVQRIEAAEALYRSGVGSGGKPLCALIGLSGMREAGDLKVMDEASGGRCRFIGLSGAGGAVDTLAEQARRLLSGALRPDVAVVGIGEFMLIKPVLPPPPESPWVVAMRNRDLRLLAKTAKDRLWFVERRRDVNGTIEAFLIGIKQEMLRLSGVSRDAGDNPLESPWREMLRMEVPEHPSATALRIGLEAYKARGAYDPASFASAKVQAQLEALNSIVRGLRSRGSVVLVAVMPERSELRARIPPDGMAAIRRGLQEGFGADAPPLLDLRDAVPDDGFTDLTHVNSQGRRIVSRLLGGRVAEVLPAGRAPLMSAR